MGAEPRHGAARIVGAASFKRNRGAHGVIEYMAVHADHLGRAQRAAVGSFAHLLERFAVPRLQQEGW